MISRTVYYSLLQTLKHYKNMACYCYCYCYAQFSFAQEESNVYASTINPCPQCLEISQVGFSLDRCSYKYKYTYKYNHKYYVHMDQKLISNIHIISPVLCIQFQAEIVLKDIMDHYLVLMWRIFSQWNNHNMTRMKMTRMAKLGFWSASCGTFIPSTAVTHICPTLSTLGKHFMQDCKYKNTNTNTNIQIQLHPFHIGQTF